MEIIFFIGCRHEDLAAAGLQGLCKERPGLPCAGHSQAHLSPSVPLVPLWGHRFQPGQSGPGREGKGWGTAQWTAEDAGAPGAEKTRPGVGKSMRGGCSKEVLLWTDHRPHSPSDLCCSGLRGGGRAGNEVEHGKTGRGENCFSFCLLLFRFQPGLIPTSLGNLVTQSPLGLPYWCLPLHPCQHSTLQSWTPTGDEYLYIETQCQET